MSVYLWNTIKDIEKKLKKSSHVLFLLDYDGTLATIASVPNKAKLPDNTKKVLTTLKKSKKITLGIVTGRGIDDIKKQIGIPGIVYAGNHGMEWEIEEKIYVMPGMIKTRELFLKILADFSQLEKKYEGVLLEDKNLSLSIHYRMLRKDLHVKFLHEFEEFMKPYLNSSLIELLRNKMVIDIMPNVKWGKGSFINWLLSTKKSPPLTIYIGDDRTDEDAFSELKRAITIKVGTGETHAKYFLEDIDDIATFLKWVDKCLQQHEDEKHD